MSYMIIPSINGFESLSIYLFTYSTDAPIGLDTLTRLIGV